MSTLQVANISDGTDTVATGYVVNGSAKAWFNINSATPAIRESLNISSLTDGGTGLYEGTFSSAMSNGNYVAIATSSATGSTNSYTNNVTTGDDSDSLGLHSTSAIRVNSYSNNVTALSDPNMLQAGIIGDLA